MFQHCDRPIYVELALAVLLMVENGIKLVSRTFDRFFKSLIEIPRYIYMCIMYLSVPLLCGSLAYFILF